MSLLPQLLKLARQSRHTWLGRQSPAARPTALRAVATSSMVPPLPPPGVPHSSAFSSTSRTAAAPNRKPASAAPHRHRRAVAAASGRRSNLFLDDSAAPRPRGRPQEPDREPAPTAPLYDSSRFNYDSDEEEEEEGQQAEEQQAVADDQPAAGQQGPGSAAAASAAAAAQQQRRARRGAAAGSAGEAPASSTAAGIAADESGVAEIVLPPPRGVKVKTAEFVKSSVNVEQCPPARYPEFAVIGRSNVGKSSLINMLTGRNALAMVSKTPGKTRCINHFIINNAWYLVDLPGYGYAKTSKGNVVEWNRFTREYFSERETLVTVLLLVDASIPPMALDIACAAWFADAEIPFTVVFTKLDKRKKGVSPADENIAAFERQVAEACGYVPPSILTSSKSGKGRNELLAHVAQLRDFFNKQNHGM